VRYFVDLALIWSAADQVINRNNRVGVLLAIPSVPLMVFLGYRDQILPFAITALKNAGYSLVTVAECLGMEPYQNGITSLPEPQLVNVGLHRRF
jgi:hypothetical protein